MEEGQKATGSTEVQPIEFIRKITVKEQNGIRNSKIIIIIFSYG